MQSLIEEAARETEPLRWEAEPAFFRPDYRRALSCVLPTIFELLGKPVAGFPTLAPYLPEASKRPARRVFLLCVDAFGFREFAMSPRLSALYRDYGTWITSVFPSITSCALTSIYQGLPPARHGLVGHLIWKDFPGAVVDMLRMQVVGARATLAESGFDLKQWRREPSILEPPHNGTVPGIHLMPEPIVNSGLSTYIYGDAERMGYTELVEGFTKAARMLEELPPGWVGLYTPLVDSLGHVLGDAPQLGVAVRYLEEALAWMAGALPEQVAAETTLIVVADHGQSVTRRRISLAGEPMEWLQRHTRGVGFSGRVMHVYLEGGSGKEKKVVGWLREFLGDAGRVFSFAEAAPLAGEGDDPDWLRRSLGDLVVVLHEGCNWEKKAPPDNPYATRLLSQHGAMSWDEMFVPLLCVPLSALLPD